MYLFHHQHLIYNQVEHRILCIFWTHFHGVLLFQVLVEVWYPVDAVEGGTGSRRATALDVDFQLYTAFSSAPHHELSQTEMCTCWASQQFSEIINLLLIGLPSARTWVCSSLYSAESWSLLTTFHSQMCWHLSSPDVMTILELGFYMSPPLLSI